MTKETPRKGSMAAAEKKSATIFLAIAAVITLLVVLTVFVFNTDLHRFANRAGAFWNVLGGLCFASSFAVLYFGYKEEADAKTGILWFIMMALGFMCSCGWNFDYFGL